MSAPKTSKEKEEASARPVASGSSGHDALQEHLQPFETAVEDHYATYFEVIACQVEGLAERLAQLQEQHDAIRDDLDFEELAERVTEEAERGRKTSAEAWSNLWHCVCTYRQRLRKEVLVPLRSHIEANNPGRVLTVARQSLAKSLNEAVEALPEQVTRTEPANLHVTESDDSWLLRGRKMGARLTRRIQVLMPRGNDREQVIPLRRLARRHVRNRLVAQSPSPLDEVEERIVTWMAEVERAATTAMHTLLDYERRFDHLDFHHTQQAEHATLQPSEPSLNVTETLDVPPAPPSSDDVQVLQAMIEQVDSVFARGTSLSVDDLCGPVAEQITEAVEAMQAHADQPRSLSGNDQSLAIPPRPWEAWSDQAAQRLALCETMLGFCDEIEDVRDKLINGVAEQGSARVEQELQEAAGQIETQEEYVEDLLPEAEAVSEFPSERLWERLLAAASAAEEKGEALRHASLDADVREVVDASIERVQALVEKLPSEVSVHPMPDQDALPDASAQERVVAVQAGADVVWNELFFDELRTNVQRLSEVIAEEIGSITDVPDIVHFGPEAAQKELAASEKATGGRDAGEKAVLENVEELAVGALSRSIQRIDGSRRRVDAATTQWADAVWTAFRQGMTGRHGRWSTENRILDRFVQLSSRVSRGTREVTSDAQLVKQG